MTNNNISNFAKIVLLIEFLLVAYMLYVLTSSIYKSYQIDRSIATFEEENKKIAEENLKLSEDFEYYASLNYQEKIAKQNFGLINPGEEVIILPEADIKTFSEEKSKEKDYINRWNSISTPRKWRFFFFDRGNF